MKNGKKVVLVTGSSKGIGRGIAVAFAQKGYDVAIHYRSSENEAEELKIELESLGVRTCVLQGDTADPEVPERLVKEAVRLMGRLDVFVANAGFFAKDSLSDSGVDLMDRIYRTNYRGMVLGIRAAARYFRENSISGVILVNTSVRAYCPHVDDCTYGALKAGMNRLIQSYAMDLGPDGIRIVGFAPGVINVTSKSEEEEKEDPFYGNTHRFIPLRRNGRASDIGRPVAWLASDDAGYITGTTIQIDGGLSCIGAPEDMLGVRQAFDI